MLRKSLPSFELCSPTITHYLVAWYMYEYFLTLHIEVEVIWKSKFSLTAILFLINRYAYLLQQSFQLMLDIVSAQNTKVSDLVTEI